MDKITVVLFYLSIVGIIFFLMIVSGCALSEQFKEDFIKDWNRYE